jgi:hypothetical protein
MKKVAYLVGNQTYPASPLRTPVNDAKSLGDRLENLGFQTIVRVDATARQMEEGLVEFAKALQDNEIGFIFFAGHGLQIEGKNYLTAVDTGFDEEYDVKYSSLPLDKVIDVMEKGVNRTSIIVLDACRNNPYERQWRGGEARGLAPVYAPKGMIIAYATSPGQTASDGKGVNGTYTSALLQHISTQDISIEDLFKRVRNTLSSATSGKQISWEHTSLMGDFYFNPSILTGELVTEYSKEALADSEFRQIHGNAAVVIQGLRSHDWYTQNPAMRNVGGEALREASKDELFVIGRNIYQAACGTAADASKFVENLKSRLSRFSSEQAFHILNGMLYEIYFDSQNCFRERAKTNELDNVFLLEGDAAFTNSFDFIREALKPYEKELFYMPGSMVDVRIDVTTVERERGRLALLGVHFEGDNVLYDEDGKYVDAARTSFLTAREIADVKLFFRDAMIAPSYRLHINYVGRQSPPEILLMPFRAKILRYSKGSSIQAT